MSPLGAIDFLQTGERRAGPPSAPTVAREGNVAGLEIIGESACLNRVLKQVKAVATTVSTVLILGETGTGKELIARAIHNLSPRRDRAFICTQLCIHSRGTA